MNRRGSLERVGPRHQCNWDARAAANFIGGGAGGGLLFWAAAAPMLGADARPLLLIGLALVGVGLTCVWFEIGRPWRALNVFRHHASSWMSREALVAPMLFFAGAYALASGSRGPALWASGLLGLAFLYCQARMLNANKGIPVWRHPQCAQLVVTTGLVEGLALLLQATAGAPRHLQIALLLAALAAWRALAWRRFRAALARDGAPAAALDALRSIDSGFFWGGNAAPALLAVASVALSLPALAVIAGLAAAAGGAWLKYTLVCRAAYTQGFALPTLAVRGQGAAAPGVKPGWAQPARTG